MNINKRYLISSLYIFLLLALSGNPFFSVNEDVSKYIFAVFVFLLVVFHSSYFNISKKSTIPYFIYVALFIIVFLIQKINLDFFSIPGSLGFLLKITFGYIVIRYLGNSFRSYFFNMMFLVCLVSLFGYSLTLSGFDFPDLLKEPKESVKSIILYTENTGDVAQGLRNSGMFWEPGAFAGYICLLFLLYLGEIRLLIRKNKFKSMIIFIALVTTFSTTGYLVLFLVGVVNTLKEFSNKYRIFALFFSALLLIASVKLFNNIDFLNNKVSSQFESSKELSGEFSSSRFGSFLFDLHYIKKNPLSGNGMLEKTRYADHPWLQEEELGHGNGFTNFIATMGIASFLTFSWFLLKYNRKTNWFFLIGIIALLQGEQFLNFPLFLSLPFIFIYEKYNSSFAHLP